MGSTIIRLSYLKFDSLQSLGKKVQFFNPLGFEPKSAFSHKNLQNKVTFRASKVYLNEKSLIYCQETAWNFDLMQTLNRTYMYISSFKDLGNFYAFLLCWQRLWTIFRPNIDSNHQCSVLTTSPVEVRLQSDSKFSPLNRKIDAVSRP